MNVSHDPLHYGWWLTSRTAGVVALLALSLTVTLGLHLAIRGLPRRPGAAAAVRSLHQQLALVALVALLVHAVALLGDPWLRPGVAGILVPFAIGYRPVWVACGITGATLVTLLALTQYAKRWLTPSRRRMLHRFTLAGYALTVAHALGAGSDASTAWLRVLIALPALPLVFHLVLRLTNPPRPARRADRASIPR